MAEDNAHRTPSIHRLPTVSASQALKEHESSSSRRISLGLDSLNDLLQGGLRPGGVTEVYGPPGAGKTAICLQAAANTIIDGRLVVWVDAGSRVPPLRLRDIISNRSDSFEELLPKFKNYATPTLAHLIALLLSCGPSFPPTETGLIVIDSISTLLDTAYPRNQRNRRATSGRNDHQRWLNGRRQAIIGDLASRLSKLAAMRNVAILVTNNTVTKIEKETLAFLRTGITNQNWENDVVVSICLYRGAFMGSERSGAANRRHARYASVLKGADTASSSFKNKGCLVAFFIDNTGIKELPSAQPVRGVQDLRIIDERMSKKRPHDAVADSENEEGSDSEYGWGEEEAQLAAEGLVDDEHLRRTSHSTSDSSEGSRRKNSDSRPF